MTRRDFYRLSLTASAGWMALPALAATETSDESHADAGKIPKTDTHMHLFGLEHLEYAWLKNAPEINKTFLPEDFIQATRKSNVGKIVFMESGSSSDSMQEVKWVMEQATKDPRIQGIIARGTIGAGGTIEPQLDELLATGWVKGLRGSTSAELLASADFVRAMKLLAQHQLSFDLLLQPKTFHEAAIAIGKVPDTTFILDHLGNPDIKGNDFESWKKGIDELAERPNLHCKISGVITRAGANWTTEVLRPYVHHAIECFGFDRIVYGGDWPVVLRAGSYLSWSRAFEKLTREFSRDERHRLYHLNADRIYRLGR